MGENADTYLKLRQWYERQVFCQKKIIIYLCAFVLKVLEKNTTFLQYYCSLLNTAVCRMHSN